MYIPAHYYSGSKDDLRAYYQNSSGNSQGVYQKQEKIPPRRPLLSKTLNAYQKEEAWKNAKMIIMPKKRNKKDTKNHIHISLLSNENKV